MIGEWCEGKSQISSESLLTAVALCYVLIISSPIIEL